MHVHVREKSHLLRESSRICRPIVNYNRQGVAKPGMVKRHHAIPYTLSIQPLPERNQLPRPNELSMLPGIRMVPGNKILTLDKMPQIDFSWLYTVEHDVKVFDFGKVRRSHFNSLIWRWLRFVNNEGGPPPGLSSAGLSPGYGGDCWEDVEEIRVERREWVSESQAYA
jgi:hypothetical protein